MRIVGWFMSAVGLVGVVSGGNVDAGLLAGSSHDRDDVAQHLLRRLGRVDLDVRSHAHDAAFVIGVDLDTVPKIDLGNLRDGGLIQQAGGPLAGRDLFEQGERYK